MTFLFKRNLDQNAPEKADFYLLFPVCFRIVSIKIIFNMLTIRAEVRREEQREDGTFRVKIRFTQNRK